MKKYYSYLLLGIFILLLSCNKTSINNALNTQKNNTAALYIEKLKHFSRSNTDSAFYYSLKSEELLDSDINDTLKTQLNLLLGRIYFQEGNYFMSLNHFLTERNRAKLRNDKYNIAFTTFNIGNINLREKRYNESVKEFESVLNAVENNDKWLELKSRTYLSLGIVYQNKQLFEKSESNYFKALKIANQINNLNLKSLALSNLGTMYQKKKDYKKALEFHNKSFEIRNSIGDKYYKCSSLGHIGYQYFMLDSLDLAKQYILESLAISEKSNFKRMNFHSYQLLQNIYEREGDYVNEIKYLKKSLESKIEEFKSQNIQTINKLTSKYTEELDKENELLETKALIYKYAIIVLIMFFAMLIVAFYSYRQNARKTKNKLLKEKLELENKLLNEELEFKNKEVMTKAMYLIKKNKTIEQISTKLIELKDLVKKDGKKEFLSIIKDLKQQLDDNIWSEFEIYFNSIHKDFYERLNKSYDLTQNERRLCAFLKLDMSSKEISAITGQSTRSLEVARYRLRKKFNLSNSNISLVDFLNQI